MDLWDFKGAGIQIWDFWMLKMSDTVNHSKSYPIPSSVFKYEFLVLFSHPRACEIEKRAFAKLNTPKCRSDITIHHFGATCRSWSSWRSRPSGGCPCRGTALTRWWSGHTSDVVSSLTCDIEQRDKSSDIFEKMSTVFLGILAKILDLRDLSRVNNILYSQWESHASLAFTVQMSIRMVFFNENVGKTLKVCKGKT